MRWRGAGNISILILNQFSISLQDFDFKNNQISINKQLIKDSPSELKTDTSKRVISMPQFVMDRIRDFLDALAADSRFPFLVWTPAIIRHRLARYCKYAGAGRAVSQ